MARAADGGVEEAAALSSAFTAAGPQDSRRCSATSSEMLGAAVSSSALSMGPPMSSDPPPSIHLPTRRRQCLPSFSCAVELIPGGVPPGLAAFTGLPSLPGLAMRVHVDLAASVQGILLAVEGNAAADFMPSFMASSFPGDFHAAAAARRLMLPLPSSSSSDQIRFMDLVSGKMLVLC